MNVEQDSIKYIDYIREKPCTVCFDTPSDPDHLKSVGMGRNRKRPMMEHFTCVPLCRKHHIERHSMPLKEFEKKYQVNLWKDVVYYLMEYFIK